MIQKSIKEYTVVTKEIRDKQYLDNLIRKNLYINSSSSNEKKDTNSLSYLITKNLSQSDCIKLGIAVEKLLADLVMEKTLYKNIKPSKNEKGVKEKDHLFCDETNKIIYYAELKANINLDTEKSKYTVTKCLEIVEFLASKYPEYTIRWCLLAYRYLDYEDIPKHIQKKYYIIQNNVFGINQYLQILNIDLQFSAYTYKEFLNKIVDTMFSVR
jgi:hypothetical protein